MKVDIAALWRAVDRLHPKILASVFDAPFDHGEKLDLRPADEVYVKFWLLLSACEI